MVVDVLTEREGRTLVAPDATDGLFDHLTLLLQGSHDTVTVGRPDRIERSGSIFAFTWVWPVPRRIIVKRVILLSREWQRQHKMAINMYEGDTLALTWQLTVTGG